IPLMLIAVAGLTKAAQLPFSSWLTGAMVAPTPVSALLHSSTMVKAGVYILIIFAPLFSKTQVGVILAIIGAFTFLVTAMLAISQSNAKKVLAYSTISNLGLITACAGVGTGLAITAAVLLVIFHAVSKALLFMCVGTVEHKIGSRDIEDMDSLISRLPLLATMMVIGICGMYLAPFGMLISKWATIVAFMESSYGWVLVTLMAFGSAFTIFFWTKWLGKLFMRITNQTKMVDVSINISEKIAVIATSVLTLLCCIFYPIIGSLFTKDPADLAFSILNPNNILMVTIMFSILVIMILASYFGIKSHEKVISPYLCGRSVDENGQFYGSLGTYKVAHSSNYYLEEFCGEKTLLSPAFIISVILILIMIISAIIGIVII
ncbi:MAG TPA: proton-conducting transporter membrane subunit, partial [Methanocorpusculum sp.]|nr:proton-conducting transporter membrane subunit [Methanocorpusculum sp.]